MKTTETEQTDSFTTLSTAQAWSEQQSQSVCRVEVEADTRVMNVQRHTIIINKVYRKNTILYTHVLCANSIEFKQNFTIV